MRIYIYGVEIEEKIIYVGATHQLKKREAHHRCRFGSNIKLQILEETNEDSWAEREDYWIGKFRDSIVNIYPGGGPPPFKRKNFPKGHRLGIKLSSETKRKIGKRVRQAWKNPHWDEKSRREKLAASQKKLWRDQERRQKASETAQKSWEDPEARKRRSDSMKGPRPQTKGLNNPATKFSSSEEFEQFVKDLKHYLKAGEPYGGLRKLGQKYAISSTTIYNWIKRLGLRSDSA